MPTLYSADYLIPGNAPPLEGGGLLVEDGRILAVGPRQELASAHGDAEAVDFGEALLTPLLVNAHTHLELTDYPTWAAEAGETEEAASFVDWILRLIRVKRNLDRSRFDGSVVRGLELSLQAGTGAVGDILSHYPSRKAYQASPLNGTLFLESLGQDPAVILRARQGLETVLDGAEPGQVNFGVSPHAPYSISANYLSALFRKCRTEQLRCSTHLAESREEVEFIEHSRGDLVTGLYLAIGWETLVPHAAGCSPTEYLRRRGGLFPENLLVHCIHLSDEDIQLIAEAQMTLVLCPRSNARLKAGKARAGELHKAGIRLALGTDSLASSESLSVWDEMAFAHHWFEGELDAPTLFHMATLGGAEALGLATELGSLEAGKQGSFQVLKPNSLPGRSELYEYLLCPGRTEDIAQVYVRGQEQLAGLKVLDGKGIRK